MAVSYTHLDVYKRQYLTRRSPEALMDLLREKEADWEAERRRLARMGAFLHNAKDKMALAQTCLLYTSRCV